MRHQFNKVKRVVIKIGTSVLASKENRLDKIQIRNLASQISFLIDSGMEVLLVTSGAIGAGMGILGLKTRPRKLPHLQAAAAIGQNQLMKVYNDAFKARGLSTAQVLLTQEDLINRTRYLNAKNTLQTLLDYRIIPIINENDTVSVDEIKFGDNDRLSALVANLIEAGLLIILSDVDGLYTDRQDKIVSVVEEITPEIEKLASGTSKEISLGGMVTKIEAAKIVTNSGILCIIANGKTSDVLIKIIRGENVGTAFLPKGDRLAAKKRWIAFSSKPKGKVFVDEGAKEALIRRGRSLLSAGVISLKGEFGYGDMVSIIDPEGKEFARGITNYSSAELEKIRGLKSGKIEQTIGHRYYDEVVHRDNLVIL